MASHMTHYTGKLMAEELGESGMREGSARQRGKGKRATGGPDAQNLEDHHLGTVSMPAPS